MKAIKDKEEISIQEISEATNMTMEDILCTLESTHMLRVKNNEYRIYLFKSDLEKLNRPRLTVKAEDLRWTQYVSRYARKLVLEDDEETVISESALEDQAELLKEDLGDENL